jgi:hypothetical protein
MAATNALPYLPSELWLEIFSHMDDPLSIWRSRIISPNCCENVDAYFRSDIIPKRTRFFSSLPSSENMYGVKFISHYSPDDRIAWFSQPNELKFRDRQILQDTPAQLFLSVVSEDRQKETGRVTMLAYNYPKNYPGAGKDNIWRGINYRNNMVLNVTDAESASAEHADVAVDEVKGLKIYVDDEKNLVGFDWRLCFRRLLLRVGELERKP